MSDDWMEESELIPCPECGREVYGDAEACPSCGYYFTDYEFDDATSQHAQQQPRWIRITAWILLALILSWFGSWFL